MFGQSHKTKWTWKCDVTYSRGSTFSLVKQLFLGFTFISHLNCEYKGLVGGTGPRAPGYYVPRDTHTPLTRSKTPYRCVLEAETFRKKEALHVVGSDGEKRHQYLLEAGTCRRTWKDLMLVQNCEKQQMMADVI